MSHRTTRIRALLVASALAFPIACGSDVSEPPTTPNGRWRGSGVAEGLVVELDVTLTTSGGSVSGSGTVGASGSAFSLTITGTYSHPNVSLNMSATGFSTMNFAGTLSRNEMVGTVNGSGFSNMALTLVRQ